MVLFLKFQMSNKYWDKKCDFYDKYLTKDGQENDLRWPELKFSTRQNSLELEHGRISPKSRNSATRYEYSNTSCREGSFFENLNWWSIVRYILWKFYGQFYPNVQGGECFFIRRVSTLFIQFKFSQLHLPQPNCEYGTGV